MTTPPRNALIPYTPEEMEKSREDYAKLREMVLAKAKDIHRAILLLWGEEEGRQLWKDLDKKPRGKAKGSTQPQQDRILLRLYDVMASEPGQDIKSLPRKIAEWLSSGTGKTTGAIEKRLRRLLKQRDEKRRPL